MIRGQIFTFDSFSKPSKYYFPPPDIKTKAQGKEHPLTRGGQKSDDGGQRTIIRRQRTEKLKGERR